MSDKKEQLRYLQAMIARFPDKEDNPFKWNRWLGFVQGVLWSLGLVDVEQLKLQNKSGLRVACLKAKELIEQQLRKN